MRGLLAPVTAAVFAAIAIVPLAARADTKAVEHTYEIENLDAYPDKVFVAWPRTCGSTGDPLGTVSLQLNPDWVSRLHEVDYEVLDKGTHHGVPPYCLATMRIHALPASGFPRATRVATVDDIGLGKKPGETYPVLPALDDIDLPKRVPFFASDPRRVSSPFRFEAPARVRTGASLLAVHQVLAIEGVVGPAGSFVLQPKHATYTYDQPPPETVSFATDGGPNATSDAGADAGTAAPAAPEAPRHDLGTRWVYAAAIGGLLAGAAIAHYRKKREASK